MALSPFAASRAQGDGSFSADSGTLIAAASAADLPVYRYRSSGSRRAVDDVPVELAGLQIDGRERPEGIAVRRNGVASIPVEILLNELDLLARREGDMLRVDTPLGLASLDLQTCLPIGEFQFCPMESVARALALEIVFDQSEFAVSVRTAWPRTGTGPRTADVPVDVKAPTYSFSYARSRLTYQRRGGRGNAMGEGDFGGGLGMGYWRSNWNVDANGEVALRNYAYLAQRGNTRYLAGHQFMGLDPLLPGFELLGAQVAWTNRPAVVFGGDLEVQRLVSDRIVLDNALRGSGPAGGRAELRVNGELVDSQTISLSGDYVFERGRYAIDPLAVVQVYLYERPFDTVPMRIEERSTFVSDRLLPEGAALHFGGVGVEDNPLDPLSSQRPGRGHTAGFWQGRYAPTGKLTIEAAVQSTAEGEYAMGGAHVALGGAGVASALVGTNDEGEQAWRLQTEGQRRSWFWRGYLQEQDAGYRPGIDIATEQQYGEAGWSTRRWSLSAVARRARTGNPADDVDYVKPALTAQPFNNLTFSVRPDDKGEYDYLAHWAPRRNVQVSAFHDDQRDQIELSAVPTPQTRLVAGWVRDQDDRTRHSLLGYREAGGNMRWRIGAGALESEGRYGWLVETGAEIGSGLYLSAQALDDPLTPSGGATFWMSLTIDLVNTGEGFARASYRADFSQRGSISGRVVAPPGGVNEPLKGIPIRVNGEVRAYTDSNGGFHVPSLDVGVYRLELDEENLPLDTAMANKALGVQVAAGRSTPVRLGLERRVGFAGRLIDANGDPIGSARVVLLDGDGSVRISLETDRYGYFRFSELAPGTYRVRLQDDAIGETPVREVKLVDRYLFDQDLNVRQ